jgi:hypothetical protein
MQKAHKIRRPSVLFSQSKQQRVNVNRVFKLIWDLAGSRKKFKWRINSKSRNQPNHGENHSMDTWQSSSSLSF